jgi:hypothetical protein
MRVMVATAFLAVAMAGCASTPTAGQTTSPYYLVVSFKPGTSRVLATRTLDDCRREPDVIRLGKVDSENGHLRGIIYTRVNGKSARTQPLLNCLYAAEPVGSAGWPN